MFNVKNVTPVSNTRPAKDESNQLIVTPTDGLIRLTGKAAAALGVSDVNRIAVIAITDDEGNSYPAIYTSPFQHDKDEEGNIIKNEKGKSELYVGEGRSAGSKYNLKGQKLSYSNGASGSLQFSSAGVYQLLEGSNDGSAHWDVPGLDGEEGWAVDADETTVIYPLRKADEFFVPKS